MRAGFALALAFAVQATLVVEAAAQGEHDRRLAAELVVMAADARLLDAASAPPLRLAGLRARLAGALSSLPLLMRRAGSDPQSVSALRDAFTRRDWRALAVGLHALQESHPLDLRALLAAPATPGRSTAGEIIHREACAACHDAPAVDVELPALDLFAQARELPREEFAARLLLGVRGNRSTAYRNPFSDLELAALIAYYTGGRAAAPAK